LELIIFDQSLVHQELKKRIDKEAKNEAKAKKAELIAAKTQFSKLMARSNLLS